MAGLLRRLARPAPASSSVALQPAVRPPASCHWAGPATWKTVSHPAASKCWVAIRALPRASPSSPRSGAGLLPPAAWSTVTTATSPSGSPSTATSGVPVADYASASLADVNGAMTASPSTA